MRRQTRAVSTVFPTLKPGKSPGEAFVLREGPRLPLTVARASRLLRRVERGALCVRRVFGPDACWGLLAARSQRGWRWVPLRSIVSPLCLRRERPCWALLGERARRRVRPGPRVAYPARTGNASGRAAETWTTRGWGLGGRPWLTAVDCGDAPSPAGPTAPPASAGHLGHCPRKLGDGPDEALRGTRRRGTRRLHGRACPLDAPPHREMKGQQKTAETEEGTVQIQEGAVATGEDPTSVAIASIQSAATFPDPNVKYVFRTENGGQVMYRVIQVSEGQLDGQTEGTGAISGYPATQSMTQAVIQGAFTSDDTVDTEGTAAETHYTYFPGTAVGDGAAGATSGSTAAVVTTQGSEALLGQATPPSTGQFFVMMSPQEVLQGGSQRSIAPRTHPYSPKSEAPRTTRDEKRRAQHNEVERRRRDKINNWIVQLSKIIPDCSMESTKSGQSKGGILSKACDYIQELRQSNHRLSEELQGLDQLQLDNDVLRQQVEDLKNKNLLLRAQLRHHGVEVVIKNDSN